MKLIQVIWFNLWTTVLWFCCISVFFL